ncbi:hypothetical protein [Phaeobacter sp.]|uniref:hypothetical protein n=1 Tax=Phaeobacter sp. TaxID=1902409 RepID=UPI0025D9BF7C|nr:hypothetical protein [Phaeobacter sp.]
MTHMANKWISIKKLKAHEFHTTLRRLHKKENTWARRFEILSELETNAIQHFIKLCSQILLSYLVLTSLREGNFLKVSVQNFEASVPAAYFLATSSFLYLMSAVSFCHLSVAVSLKANECGKMLLPGFSTSIFGLLRGKKDDISLGLTMYSNSFLREKLPTSSFLSFAMLLGIFAMLIPVGAFGYLLLTQQIEIMLDATVPIVERIAVLAGSALAALSFAYVFLFHLPLPTKKHVNGIRWNFLYYLPNGRHPRIDHWIGRN